MSASESEKIERKKSKSLKLLVKSQSKTESDIVKHSGESKKGLAKTMSLREVKDKKSDSKIVSKSSSLQEIGEFKTANFRHEGKISRGQLQRQLSISKQDSDMELKTSRQLFKDDSHDSGIVLETNTKSKQSVNRLNSQEESREETRQTVAKSSKKGSTIFKIVKSVKSNKRRTTSASNEAAVYSGASSEVKSSRSRSSSEKQAESELLLSGQNQSFDNDDKDEKKNVATFKGIWKKAVKNLSIDKQTWQGKKGSFIKRKDTDQQDNETVESIGRDVDPVYSLLKCAADLPKVGKIPCMYCNGHHNASKPCSPVDSGSSSSQVPRSPSSDLHGIVEQSLGSEFKQFYKLTSPTNKTSTPFDHII